MPNAVNEDYNLISKPGKDLSKKLGLLRLNVEQKPVGGHRPDKLIETLIARINMFGESDGGVISFETLENRLVERLRIDKTGLNIFGNLNLVDNQGINNIRFHGSNGDIISNGNIISSNIISDGNITLRSKMYVGSHQNNGLLSVKDSKGTDTITLDGGNGNIYAKDILLDGADCAEEFDIACKKVDEGTVMVVNNKGMLQPCQKSYDKRVAGVISGAGEYKPGIILDKQPSKINRQPIALIGKTFCKVDAKKSPIEIGDILTTSKTNGHAMKATDSSKAFGSVIGKALHSFKEGRGMIPILIALQ